MKLALCVSGQARDFATFVSEWHALVVRHLIASRFSQADTFLLLSEVKYESRDFDTIKSRLQPVLAIASPTSDCSAPLLKPLCDSLPEAERTLEIR